MVTAPSGKVWLTVQPSRTTSLPVVGSISSPGTLSRPVRTVSWVLPSPVLQIWVSCPSSTLKPDT
ncbi:MAG TPA: hypothetical protein VFD01_10400, partial [Candidatus Dormibacteraeota bacterium]|nr:hypothetical protein [Candidatus Dormibacteraeota bacterium]